MERPVPEDLPADGANSVFRGLEDSVETLKAQ